MFTEETNILEEQKLDESLYVLGLSFITLHELRRCRINTVRELCQQTPQDLLKIRFIHEKRLKEITEKLEKYGFKLKESEDVYERTN